MIEVEINNYKNALVEVEAVLDCLNYEDYKKIPYNIIEVISKNKNPDYIYKYDKKLDYEDWDMMLETKAILYNIFRNYLANQEQKEIIIEKEKAERLKIEEEKAKRYNSNNIFKSSNSIVKATKDNENVKNQKKNESSSRELIEHRESIFRKIMNIIKKFL